MQTVVSILGTSGAVFDHINCLPKKHTKALYDLSLFKKESKEYKNSTEFLLDNFDEKFIFIGTKCAIKFQKALLKEKLNDKNVIFEEVSENNLDEIFEKIFKILEDNEDTILDITHGYRDQSIMAIFASTLSRFLDRKSLKIIFAKEEERFKRYRYVYLDEYIEITQISLIFTGFIRTLNFIPIKNIKLFKTKVFEDFSKSLLSNDIKGVEKNYTLLKNELDNLLKNSDLKYLYKLLEDIKGDLSPLNDLANEDVKTYQKYLVLSKITLEKNYLVVSLAYLFEAVREYCSYSFKSHLKGINIKKSYKLNTSVMDTVSNFKRNGKKNVIQKIYPNLYKKNRDIFRKIANEYEYIRKLRNDLAHINQEKDFKDIKQMIQGISLKVEAIFKDDILKNIKI